MEETIARMVESIGIAGATVFFLLFYFSKKIDQLTEAINALVNQMEKRDREFEKRFERLERDIERRNGN